jgi:hypothetical protein
MRRFRTSLLCVLVAGLVLGLAWFFGPFVFGDPSVAIQLSTSSTTSNGKTSFLLINPLPRDIDVGIPYVSIKVNGQWQSAKSSGEDVGLVRAHSTKPFSLPTPPEGEAWRVLLVNYVTQATDFEMWFDRMDTRVYTWCRTMRIRSPERIFGILDRRTTGVAVSPEIVK